MNTFTNIEAMRQGIDYPSQMRTYVSNVKHYYNKLNLM
jgi:hypothetical protein